MGECFAFSQLLEILLIDSGVYNNYNLKVAGLYEMFNETITGSDDREVFSKFYEKHRKAINDYFDANYGEEVNGKDVETAEEIKMCGNTHFAGNKYPEALKAYNEALCEAPFDSECYALVLGNRSAVFYEQNNYKACLQDIEHALLSNFPSNLKAKLFVRKAACHAALAEKVLFRKTVDHAKQYIQNKGLKDAEKYLSQLAELKLRAHCGMNNVQKKKYSLEKLQYKKHATYLNASSGVDLK